jgi:hypothetical protein
MLFADSVLMVVEGSAAKLVPVGPPNRYLNTPSETICNRADTQRN